MVYVRKIPGTGGYMEASYWHQSDASGRKAEVVSDAKEEARQQVNTHYPYAVIRDRQGLTQLAEQAYKEWFALVEREKPRSTSQKVVEWETQQGELRRLYVATFVGTYLEELTKRDEAARPKPQPQPQVQPQPTAQPVTSPTGASITIINQTHQGDVHTYWVRIADPRNFDEAQDFPLPLVVDFSDAPITDTSASAGSMRGIAMGNASYSTASSTPQKKKPRLYFGNR